MKKVITLCIGLAFLACSGEKMIDEAPPRTDVIVGRWEEVLDQGSLYDQITWTFTAAGEMQLDFDDDYTAYGEWTNLNTPENSYSLSFQQYPDATKRTFFVALDFNTNKTTVNITDDASTFHWVSNRALIKLE